ncbi:MAG TPA: TetR/AcrR family transcriptional regulator [Anaeromyxobacteraceae bacterium]|nr:TetR/AcrR family transcriptional regulator [Anaeromyxobacteraceae bacterium]
MADANAAELGDKESVRKQAIGRAAAKLFDRKGYLETSLKDISDEAAASKGAIYYYFSSKHEILFFILDTYMDSLLHGLEDELRGVPPGEKRIEFIIRRHLSLYNNRVPEAKALLLDAPNLPSKEFKVIAAKQKRYARVLVDALSEYLGRKAPRVNLKAIAFILFGMCNSIMHWHDPEGPIKLEELTDMCLNIFLRGTIHYIGATDGRRTESA